MADNDSTNQGQRNPNLIPESEWLPCVICGGLVWPGSPVFTGHEHRDIHSACFQWPNAGVRYGPKPKA